MIDRFYHLPGVVSTESIEGDMGNCGLMVRIVSCSVIGRWIGSWVSRRLVGGGVSSSSSRISVSVSRIVQVVGDARVVLANG